MDSGVLKINQQKSHNVDLAHDIICSWAQKMSKIQELEHLERSIKDSENSLKSIICNIELLDKEISVLTPRKAELERNIEFHKKSGTVPIAQEYKKTKAELSKTTARLILINSDRKKADEAAKDVVFIIEKLKKDHANLLKTSENNVLRPSFGGKCGQD